MSHTKVHIWTQPARAQGAGGSRNGSSVFLLSEVSLHKHLPQSAPKEKWNTTGTSWHSPTLPWPQPLEKRFRVPTQGQQEPVEGLCAPLLISETPLTPLCVRVGFCLFVFFFFYVGRERERQGKCPDCWVFFFFAAATEFWLSID